MPVMDRGAGIKIKTFKDGNTGIVKMSWSNGKEEHTAQSAPFSFSECDDYTIFGISMRLASKLRLAGGVDPDVFLDAVDESVKNPFKDVSV